ncbi:pentapeptide repeat-containing protein [Mycobacterium haemophilum]
MDVRQPADQFNNQNYSYGSFDRAKFEEMTLVNTIFRRAKFGQTNMRGVKFQHVDLANASLPFADLTGATFDAATSLNGAGVTGAMGLMPPLELVLHTGGGPQPGGGMEMPVNPTSDDLKPTNFTASPNITWRGCRDNNGNDRWGPRDNPYIIACTVRDGLGGTATGAVYLTVRSP